MTDKKIEILVFNVTEKVKRLLFDYKKGEFCSILEINPRTLENRINKNTWTYKEVLIIENLYSKKIK